MVNVNETKGKKQMPQKYTIAVYDYDANDIRTEISENVNDALARAKYISENETHNGLPTSTAVLYGPPYNSENDRPIAQFPICPLPF